MTRITTRASFLATPLLALAAATAEAQWEWGPFVPYPNGDSSPLTASGDLDGDGNADIVRVTDSGFVVLLGDGRGGLRRTSRIVSITPIESLRIADVDGDGDDDVLTVRGYFDDLELHESDGSGGFSGRYWFDCGGFATDVDASDVDGDGFLDAICAVPGILSTGGPPSGIAIWHGTATPPYLARFVFIPTATNPSQVAFADFDLDGRADLALGEEGSLSIRLADGRGGFAPPVAIATLSIGRYGDVVAGDLTGDLSPELIVSHDVAGASVTSFLEGDLASGFTERLRFDLGRVDTAAVIGDVDRDGLADFLCPGEPAALLHLADGSGGFVSFPSAALAGRCGALADLEGDGYPEFAGRGGFARNLCHEARRGFVNAGAGPIADVLLVNGLPGDGRERTARLDPFAPFTLVVNAPPSMPFGPARFALYLWSDAEPTSRTAPIESGFGLGRAILPTPLTGGAPAPSLVWNGFRGTEDRLGVPNRFSAPAPVVLVDREPGIRRETKFFLQGIIRDDGAPNGRAAMTNAIQVIVR